MVNPSSANKWKRAIRDACRRATAGVRPVTDGPVVFEALVRRCDPFDCDGKRRRDAT